MDEESSDDFEIIHDWELVNDVEDSEFDGNGGGDVLNKPSSFEISSDFKDKDEINQGNLDERFAVDEEDDEETVVTKFHLAVGCRKLRDLERMSRQRIQADDAQLPPDPDDRCESDISGADDDTDLSSFSPGLLDVSLLDGNQRAPRSYTHEPNRTLDNFLSCIAVVALFFAIGAGVGHYVGLSIRDDPSFLSPTELFAPTGTDQEILLRRLQMERVRSLEEEFKLCFKHAGELQAKLEGFADYFDKKPAIGTNDSTSVDVPSEESRTENPIANVKVSDKQDSGGLPVQSENLESLRGSETDSQRNLANKAVEGEFSSLPGFDSGELNEEGVLVPESDLHPSSATHEVSSDDDFDGNAERKGSSPSCHKRSCRGDAKQVETKSTSRRERVSRLKRSRSSDGSHSTAKHMMSELRRLLGSLTEDIFDTLSHDDIKAYSQEFSYLFKKLDKSQPLRNFPGDGDVEYKLKNDFLWSSCQKKWWKLLRESHYMRFTSLKKHKREIVSKLKMNKCASFYETWQLKVACEVLHSTRDDFKSDRRGNVVERDDVASEDHRRNVLCSELSVFLSGRM